MKLPITLIAFTLTFAALLLVGDGPLQAQTNEQAKSNPPGGNAGAAKAEIEPTDFSFPGGTLQEFAGQLEAMSDHQLKLMVDQEIADLPIAPFEARNAISGDILEYLTAIAGTRFQIEMVFLSNGGLGRPNAQRIDRISAPPSTTAVFSLRRSIPRSADDREANQQVAQILETIQAALDLGSLSIPKVKLKYHPGTALLIASGTEEQLKVIEGIVSETASGSSAVDVDFPERTALGKSEGSSELKDRLAELEVKVQKLQDAVNRSLAPQGETGSHKQKQ